MTLPEGKAVPPISGMPNGRSPQGGGPVGWVAAQQYRMHVATAEAVKKRDMLCLAVDVERRRAERAERLVAASRALGEPIPQAVLNNGIPEASAHGSEVVALREQLLERLLAGDDPAVLGPPTEAATAWATRGARALVAQGHSSVAPRGVPAHTGSTSAVSHPHAEHQDILGPIGPAGMIMVGSKRGSAERDPGSPASGSTAGSTDGHGSPIREKHSATAASAAAAAGVPVNLAEQALRLAEVRAAEGARLADARRLLERRAAELQRELSHVEDKRPRWLPNVGGTNLPHSGLPPAASTAVSAGAAMADTRAAAEAGAANAASPSAVGNFEARGGPGGFAEAESDSLSRLVDEARLMVAHGPARIARLKAEGERLAQQAAQAKESTMPDDAAYHHHSVREPPAYPSGAAASWHTAPSVPRYAEATGATTPGGSLRPRETMPWEERGYGAPWQASAPHLAAPLFSGLPPATSNSAALHAGGKARPSMLRPQDLSGAGVGLDEDGDAPSRSSASPVPSAAAAPAAPPPESTASASADAAAAAAPAAAAPKAAAKKKSKWWKPW
eukprot:gnl/TRDRNA2_/TRDRNA2_161201_c0_seq1.p1 gnl/TRDRNA2_/TRDRNA2_161201_c0~~gnl/TRDRNA2_/TRDRNA2_161201_c0_seq1.p1  ORF type:complete len:561 (+),score=105.24 gnl/TRDRNA2_/TRDRNA2_161201_c0_seq1:113-1795(+)